MKADNFVYRLGHTWREVYPVSLSTF